MCFLGRTPRVGLASYTGRKHSVATVPAHAAHAFLHYTPGQGKSGSAGMTVDRGLTSGIGKTCRPLHQQPAEGDEYVVAGLGCSQWQEILAGKYCPRNCGFARLSELQAVNISVLLRGFTIDPQELAH